MIIFLILKSFIPGIKIAISAIKYNLPVIQKQRCPGFFHLDVTNKTLKLWGCRYGSISKALVVQAEFSISKSHELIRV